MGCGLSYSGRVWPQPSDAPALISTSPAGLSPSTLACHCLSPPWQGHYLWKAQGPGGDTDAAQGTSTMSRLRPFLLVWPLWSHFIC